MHVCVCLGTGSQTKRANVISQLKEEVQETRKALVLEQAKLHEISDAKEKTEKEVEDERRKRCIML